MTDLLIRDVPEDVLAAIDQRAKRLVLSRTEYLRRTLTRDAALADTTVTTTDLDRFSHRFADLADAEVMRQAWG
jgi:hypothetical protein